MCRPKKTLHIPLSLTGTKLDVAGADLPVISDQLDEEADNQDAHQQCSHFDRAIKSVKLK